MTTYAARLRFARDRRHLTQVQLAKLAGVQRHVITRLESGQTTRPHTATIVNLARALRVNPSWLSGKSCPMARDLWFVYWLTNHYHAIVYVGMTGNLLGRIEQHRFQPWAGEIFAHAYQVFATWDDARATEQAAIVALCPRYNIQDTPRLLERTKLVR